MARHRDTRSPSPVGSSYSSKRNRRDEDRYDRSRRDDGRGYRNRSRTRSPDVRISVFLSALRFPCISIIKNANSRLLQNKSHEHQRRYRDRDSRPHRDRSRDRREEDSYRSGRRDRDVTREYRPRSRERLPRRADSRDRDGRRREASTDARRRGRREDSRERNHKKSAHEVCPHVIPSNTLINPLDLYLVTEETSNSSSNRGREKSRAIGET